MKNITKEFMVLKIYTFGKIRSIVSNKSNFEGIWYDLDDVLKILDIKPTSKLLNLLDKNDIVVTNVSNDKDFHMSKTCLGKDSAMRIIINENAFYQLLELSSLSYESIIELTRNINIMTINMLLAVITQQEKNKNKKISKEK